MLDIDTLRLDIKILRPDTLPLGNINDAVISKVRALLISRNDVTLARDILQVINSASLTLLWPGVNSTCNWLF